MVWVGRGSCQGGAVIPRSPAVALCAMLAVEWQPISSVEHPAASDRRARSVQAGPRRHRTQRGGIERGAATWLRPRVWLSIQPRHNDAS